MINFIYINTILKINFVNNTNYSKQSHRGTLTRNTIQYQNGKNLEKRNRIKSKTGMQNMHEFICLGEKR